MISLAPRAVSQVFRRWQWLICLQGDSLWEVRGQTAVDSEARGDRLLGSSASPRQRFTAAGSGSLTRGGSRASKRGTGHGGTERGQRHTNDTCCIGTQQLLLVIFAVFSPNSSVPFRLREGEEQLAFIVNPSFFIKMRKSINVKKSKSTLFIFITQIECLQLTPFILCLMSQMYNVCSITLTRNRHFLLALWVLPK